MSDVNAVGEVDFMDGQRVFVYVCPRSVNFRAPSCVEFNIGYGCFQLTIENARKLGALLQAAAIRAEVKK
jgi:hypothetical protein